MKRIIFSLVLSLTLVPAWGAPTKESEFTIPNPEVTELKNGLRIMWIPDTNLPYISFMMMLRSGAASDPAGKEGLASFTCGMLDKGTSKRSATRIADDLAQLGASFEAQAESDYMMLSSGSLSMHREDILKQFSEIVLNPIFPNSEIERQRKITVAGLMRVADSPEQFTEMNYPAFVFGKHPYGHDASGTLKSVKQIKKVDIQKFYAAEFVPNKAVLAVVGQFDDGFKKTVIKTFEGWKSKPGSKFSVPEFPAWTGIKSLLIDRPDLQQAQIQILYKGVPRNMKQYLELRAGLKILGESFGSRLFEEIRVKRGLTYHINAWFDPREQAGPMGIYTFTRTDKIDETITESLNVLRKFIKEGVTDRELSDVKALMRGQLPRMLETKEALARQLLTLERYGVSIDYFNNYFANLDKMTKEDVNKTITQYFDPENLKIVVYAPKDKALNVLKSLGSVEVKNYKDFLKL